MPKTERILIIRLGALGDMVLCCQAFQDIRRAHPGAEIALLTTPAFASLGQTMPWFDRVIIDERAPGWRLDLWAQLIARIRSFNPTRIYDLQGKRRQSVLYTLLGGPFGTSWSGAAPFCAYPRLWPPEPTMHFTDFVAAQLRNASVSPTEPVDFSWLHAPLDGFDLPQRYALLVPGCGIGRDYKKWPAASYAALADRLRAEGITSIAIGTTADAPAIDAVRTLAPHIVNFMGRTSLAQLAALARKTTAVIGNDSGPTHLMAAVGAPTLALISDRVNPFWSAPRGPQVAWRQGRPLANLRPDEVLLALKELLDKNNR